MLDMLQAWGLKEKTEWFARQTIQRSYAQDVIARLDAMPSGIFAIQQYGALSYDPERYPLYRALSSGWDDSRPSLLFTGGVHGYEPSGVISSLRFLEEIAPEYAGRINFAAYPCISPLAYEINHRWNHNAEDPNRQFFNGATAEEAVAVMRSVDSLGKHFAIAADLHETNALDPQMTADRRHRDGEPQIGDYALPNGFYLYISKSGYALGRQIAAAVQKITPVCTEETILDEPADAGLIVSDDAGLTCKSFAARYAGISMTTEIVPVGAPRKAQDGQLATIRASIEYALKL